MSELLSYLEKFSEFLTTDDLVKLGLFKSKDSVVRARRLGQSPDYIKLKRYVKYPKSCVIEFIQQHLVNGSIPKKQTTINQG